MTIEQLQAKVAKAKADWKAAQEKADKLAKVWEDTQDRLYDFLDEQEIMAELNTTCAGCQKPVGKASGCRPCYFCETSVRRDNIRSKYAE